MTEPRNADFTRRNFLGLAAAAGIAATQGCTGLEKGRAGRPPNVVFVFSDEHRWQSMAHTELPEVYTPNMTRLAAQGTEFTRCISNYPVCSPYRAMMMTGRWPYEQGVIDNNIALSPEHMTIGKAFQQSGYDTGYIGKWHLVGTRAEPFGFDHSLIWERTNAHWDESIYYPADGDPVQPKGYNATLMTDQALEYMRAHQNEPFFLMLSLNPPHANFLDAPDPKLALYPEGSLPRRPNTSGLDPELGEEGNVLKANDWAHYRGYHAHISAIDDELGRVMAALDELGIADDTILIYTSDHGSMFGSHGVGSKRQPFEESIRVPFIVRWPGNIPSGEKVEALFGTIDLCPTLCALAGIAVPEDFQGQDFSGHVLRGDGPAPESQFIMHIAKENASGGNEHPAPIFRGVRGPRYTYAVLAEGGGMLFDNETDPFQMNNRYADPVMADVRRGHHAMLEKCLRAASDPFIASS
jgi:arylsulfatase A-like enzyme